MATEVRDRKITIESQRQEHLRTKILVIKFPISKSRSNLGDTRPPPYHSDLRHVHADGNQGRAEPHGCARRLATARSGNVIETLKSTPLEEVEQFPYEGKSEHLVWLVGESGWFF